MEASRGHAMSRDGTRISFTVTQARKADAPWIVLANGPWPLPPLGLVDYLGDRYRFAWWDPRGMGGSSGPAASDRQAHAVERHVEDLDAVARASGIEEAAFVGLGTGTQVALEAYRRRPGTVRALVLVAGTFGRERIEAPAAVLRSGLRSLAARLATRHPREATRLVRRVAASRSGVFLARRLGLVGADLDDAEAAELVGALADSDLEPILETMLAARDHDAARILPE
ncbi:MAG TPA: alpha/beta fold hydrolase, partial [Polyangiaceae bacterium]|nr:alpha/beta fold hydrolase [Polyangiaceae bacterium]